MDKFLDICVLPRLNQEEAKTMNRPITRSEVEAAIKSLPHKKKPWSRWVHGRILPDTQRGTVTIPSETIPKNPKRRNPSQSFYETNIILTPKPGKDSTRKENFRPISMMNIDTKIFNKILAS